MYTIGTCIAVAAVALGPRSRHLRSRYVYGSDIYILGNFTLSYLGSVSIFFFLVFESGADDAAHFFLCPRNFFLFS